MSKRYYARGNRYGSDSSRGFANTNYVLAFDGRAARDAWIEQEEDLTAAPILRSEATRIAANWDMNDNREIKPAPFSEEYWGLLDWDWENVDGCLGEVCVCTPDSQAPRFHA